MRFSTKEPGPHRTPPTPTEQLSKRDPPIFDKTDRIPIYYSVKQDSKEVSILLIR